MNRIKRRATRRELKKRNKKILLSCILLLCLLSVGYGAFQTTLNVNVTGRINKCTEGRVWNIDYTGDIKEIVIPCDGTYKLESWGAQGGNSQANNYQGGYGGYSAGKIELLRSNKIYITVGGQGSVGNASHAEIPFVGQGGYNGGGSSGQGARYSAGWYFGSGAGGGGATHIATVKGELKELEAYKDTVSENVSREIFIVSGGGGGCLGHSPHPGNGGGYKGGNSTEGNAIGGTQTTGYKFGEGQKAIDSVYSSAGAEGKGGSGAGWYGGTATQLNGEKTDESGAGGSGYIGNISLTDKAMYCYRCEESLDLTKPEIFTVSTTGDSNYKDTLNCPKGYDENPVSKCAKKGNGYARITLISKK